ncbi:MAG: DUF1553 domain-containing protein [Planctomycetales bacterium]|nr:DUF1553 domain-containing protein [Planctomycetales bacterium]
MPRTNCWFLYSSILLVCQSWTCYGAESSASTAQVRAVLTGRCLVCHGPDAAKREADLRLDDPTSYLSVGPSGVAAVVPGSPQQSELWRRLTASDEDRMPPTESGPPLTNEELSVIEQWIASGAPLPPHWSFVTPQRPSLPLLTRVDNLSWGNHPIDQFVGQRLLQHGLQPTSRASKAELIRRVSLDLTGLPPTPREIGAFQADSDPNAYQKLVDRLLASPTFGEHWARKWLDLARYADSAGYADDPLRTIWKYRDWVIDAHNQGMAIDQFTVEQLAGDLLTNPTTDQLVATAFHRNTMTNNEGGTNDEEFRNAAIIDRVNTTMAVWMGVTMGCAQCHSHKYDPLTQQEYFQLFAIFNQTADADRKDESPVLELLTPAQETMRASLQLRADEIEKGLTEVTPEIEQEARAWELGLVEPEWQMVVPSVLETKSKSDVSISADGHVVVMPTGNNIVTDTYSIKIPLAQQVAPITALRILTQPDPVLPQGGAGLGQGNFVLTEVAASIKNDVDSGKLAKYVRFELPGAGRILSLAEVQVWSTDQQNVAGRGTAKQSSTAYGGDASRAIDGNSDGLYEQNSTTHTETSNNPWWELDLGSALPIERVEFFVRRDGDLHQRTDGVEIILLSEERDEVFRKAIAKAPKESSSIVIDPVRDLRFSGAFADYSQPGFAAGNVLDQDRSTGWAVGGDITNSHRLDVILAEPLVLDRDSVLELEFGFDSSHRHHLLGSFVVQMSSGSGVGDWAAVTAPLHKVLATPSKQRTQQENVQWFRYFAQFLAPSRAALRAEREGLLRRIRGLKPETSVPIMQPIAENLRRKSFVQLRGNYKAIGDQVSEGVPAAFHPFVCRGNTPDRLDFAKWLVDPKNPLTARVWVNRVWESLFGQGIVRTSEEFGAQGEYPSHPELLDWLACEFMALDLDPKQLLRLIVTSETYQQSSQATPAKLDLDPGNSLFSRGPRVRLSAEMVRDQALAVSGLLTHEMYGPPVQPPQPSLGLKAAFGSDTDWKTSAGADRYRRGVYTSWRRSNPYPSMATFDAPTREVCTLRRDQTNTPLQALVTLNDPVFVEAAQALARQIVLYSNITDDKDRLRAAFVSCLGRSPNDRELDSLGQLIGELSVEFAKDQQAAQRLATEPLGELPPQAQAAELAAWTAVCNVLLNLDEFLMKR